VKQPEIPVAQRVFGESVYWLCVVAAIVCMVGPVIALVAVDSNVMNPHFLFASIFGGNTADVVWREVGGEFPGGHFWIENMATGDGFTQLGLVVGCACALPALVATAAAYLFKSKEKSSIWVFFCLIIAALVTISMLGVFSIQ